MVIVRIDEKQVTNPEDFETIRLALSEAHNEREFSGLSPCDCQGSPE